MSKYMQPFRFKLSDPWSPCRDWSSMAPASSKSAPASSASTPASSKSPKKAAAPVKDPKQQKLAQRVQGCIDDQAVNKKERQIDPNWILVSPLNRLGTAPNVHRIHWGILYSFMQNAYDSSRPQIGVCIEIKSEKGLKALMEHNRRFLVHEPV